MADNKQIATDVLALVGGAENVQVATNCMTRLRLTLVDNAKADVEKIKKVKGVLGCQFSGSQLQVIIGQNVPKVLDEFVAISGVKQGAAVNENLDAPKQKFELKQLPNIILDYLSGSMTQLIPLLMAGGLFRTFAVIIGPMMLNLVPETDPTYTFFYTTLYEATFTFLPIYLGYAAAKRDRRHPESSACCSVASSWRLRLLLPQLRRAAESSAFTASISPPLTISSPCCPSF